MSALVDLRDAVVAALAAVLPGVDVATHGGTFDQAELERFATLAPAVRVCIVGVGAASLYADGRWRLPAHFAAVVVARDKIEAGVKIQRDLAALGLACAVEIAVAGNRFGLEGVFRPEDLTAKSEYSGSLDKTGVALWQVTWSSGVLVGAAGDGEGGNGPGDAIAALSQLWINGVQATGAGADPGAEILPDFTASAPSAPTDLLPPVLREASRHE